MVWLGNDRATGAEALDPFLAEESMNVEEYNSMNLVDDIFGSFTFLTDVDDQSSPVASSPTTSKASCSVWEDIMSMFWNRLHQRFGSELRHLIGFFLFLSLTIYTATKVPNVVDLHSLSLSDMHADILRCLPLLPNMADLHDVLPSLSHVDVKTTDNYTLRMFYIGFTKRRPNQVKRTTYAQSS
ncbi:hypothetical protein Drorol1_Dr00019268 [Drosera rotundifolia]